jgi:acyl-CoA synthetase (AMP-forming)/AMP-acid ligase II
MPTPANAHECGTVNPLVSAFAVDGALKIEERHDAGRDDAAGELFIIGRIKDLLIMYGRNHSPDDIEATIQETTGGRCGDRGSGSSHREAGCHRRIQEAGRLPRGRDGQARTRPA